MLRSGIRQECHLSPLLLNIILEVLANAGKQNKTKKGNKRCKIGKKEIKLSLFADNVIVHVENQKELQTNSRVNRQL